VGVAGKAAHLLFVVETLAMNATLRLLIPDKRGIYKRIEAAVEAGGGRIKHSRLKRQMRGMTEAEIEVLYDNDLFFESILSSLGRVPGVALLGIPIRTRATPPPAEG
jgi:hypothetical protein